MRTFTFDQFSLLNRCNPLPNLEDLLPIGGPPIV